jgi:SAM-dependent methyltransferase
MTMKLYTELAEFWPQMSGPEEFKHEAALFKRVLTKSIRPAPRTLLELGGGSGFVGSHLKSRFQMTLVDLSPHMLAISHALNPEIEHVEGDIRTLRLGRTFDAIFVHDSIAHMLTQKDLKAAMKTAFVHCRPGGVALFVPDELRETFVPADDHGGKGNVRFVQWTSDPNPKDNTILVDFGILIRDKNGDVRVVHERQNHGLFARALWLRLLREVGFKPSVVHDRVVRDMFLARRPL